VQFQRVSQRTALRIRDHNLTYLNNIERFVLGESKDIQGGLYGHNYQDEAYSPRLYQKPEPRSEKDYFSLRQVNLYADSISDPWLTFKLRQATQQF
jgi:hypothetical protein